MNSMFSAEAYHTSLDDFILIGVWFFGDAVVYDPHALITLNVPRKRVGDFPQVGGGLGLAG